MKRIFTVAMMALMTMSALTINAQNKFKGIIKYEISSVGTTPIEIPAGQNSVEVKVMGENVIVGENALQKGRSTYTFIDLGGLIGYLNSQDITLESYSGDGKIYIKNTLTQTEIDSLTIPCTEGFYIEYKEGESKKVAGMDCNKAVMHIFDDEGVDNPIEVWYCPEIGPEASFIPFALGTKGMPMEYVQTADNGRAIKYTAVEVVKGKVKDVDFLMPAGYKEIGGEQWTAFQKELEEIEELLGE